MDYTAGLKKTTDDGLRTEIEKVEEITHIIILTKLHLKDFQKIHLLAAASISQTHLKDQHGAPDASSIAKKLCGLKADDW